MTKDATKEVAKAGGGRLVSIDWLRGLVMVIMAIDHASVMLNAGRTADDSAVTAQAGASLPWDQFFTRWVTHLCAPTFVFLAGTALALSIERRLARGESPGSVDRQLLIRGMFILALDPLWNSTLAGFWMLQVLYAIGAAMICMVLLRRMGTGLMLGLALAWIFGGEWVTGLVWDHASPESTWWIGATVGVHYAGTEMFFYPLIPWLAVMMLGWVFGRYLLGERAAGRGTERTIRLLVLGGLGALAVGLAVRGLNGYGNLWLYREDGSLIQWLHMSKYPPSLSFLATELGIMALLLAALMKIEPHVKVRDNGPLLVFGQTALFYYLLHFPLLGAAAAGTGLGGKAGLLAVYIAAASVSLILYWPCRRYRAYKRAHPRSLARFV